MMHRSFQGKRFDKYTWLHHDEGREQILLHWLVKQRMSTKYKDAAFILRGFNNWKDKVVGFTLHEGSECHKEAVQVIKVIPHERVRVRLAIKT